LFPNQHIPNPAIPQMANMVDQPNHMIYKNPSGELMKIALYNTMFQNKLDEFVQLIQLNPGCEIHLDSEHTGETMMHLAIMNARIDFVRELTKNGASLNIKYNPINFVRDAYSMSGHDSLFQAVHICITKLLVVRNGNHIMQTIDQYYKIIIYLLESGATPNTVDSKGTPILLWICSQIHHDEDKPIIKNIITALIDHNVDVNVETKYMGQSIEHCCMMNDNDDLLELIKNYQPAVITKGVHL